MNNIDRQRELEDEVSLDQYWTNQWPEAIQHVTQEEIDLWHSECEHEYAEWCQMETLAWLAYIRGKDL